MSQGSIRTALSAIALSLLLAQVATAQTTVQHLEPPSWWVGMANRSLQLMVHGDNVSTLEPRVDYPGVKVTGTSRLSNPNYLFVDLTIDPAARPGPVELQFLADGQIKHRHPYQLKARAAGSAEREGFSAKDVIYLLTPDRFANADPANDSRADLSDSPNRRDPYGRHGGDLQGIIDHLDYLAEMGFTQLWLNPILVNDQPEQSYHGYAQTDLYQVDPRYGDNALYRELAKQARARGIGIIQDVVLNHIGSEHWWMKDLPSADWINHGGTYAPTSHHRESLHDPHAAPSDRRRFQDGWFVPTMPDLNQRNRQLANYLVQHTIWWIEYAGLSGLRIDTFPYPEHDFTGQWAKRVLAEYPGLNIVGEEWSLNPAIVGYWQRGSRRGSEQLAAGVPSMMDFPLHDAMVRAFNAKQESWNTGLISIYQALANDFQYPDPNALVVFADNHDMSRIYTQLDEDDANWRMVMTFLMTTRGIPQLFYGTEILMSNPGTQSHGVIRSDFPGGWPGDRANAFTGHKLKRKQRAAQEFVKSLLNWRKGASAIHSGKLTHYAPEDGVYTYFRHDGKQTVMVVINRNKRGVNLEPGRFAELIGDHRSAREVLSGASHSLAEPLSIDGRTAVVMELLQPAMHP